MILITIYIVTTFLSSLYILITELDGAVVINKDKKILDIFILCFIVFFMNWFITPFVLYDLYRRLKK